MKFYKTKNYEKLYISDAVSKLSWAYGEKLDFLGQLIRGFNFIENGGIEKYKKYDINNLLNSDIIHVHGGGYLNDYWPNNGFIFGLMAGIHKKIGIPIYASGIGFGPFKRSWAGKEKELLSKIFSQFEFIETRDIESFKMFYNKYNISNIKNGIDDSYVSSINKFIRMDYRNSRCMYLSLILYDFDRGIYNNMLEKLKNNLYMFDNIYLLESLTNADYLLYEKVKKIIPKIKFIPLVKFFSEGLNVSYDDFIITHRFHHHFLFARAGLNGIYISPKSDYYDVKHGSIVELGSPFVKYKDDFDFKKIFFKKNN